jgi:hypothetical protein
MSGIDKQHGALWHIRPSAVLDKRRREPGKGDALPRPDSNQPMHFLQMPKFKNYTFGIEFAYKLRADTNR